MDTLTPYQTLLPILQGLFPFLVIMAAVSIIPAMLNAIVKVSMGHSRRQTERIAPATANVPSVGPARNVIADLPHRGLVVAFYDNQPRKYWIEKLDGTRARRSEVGSELADLDSTHLGNSSGLFFTSLADVVAAADLSQQLAEAEQLELARARQLARDYEYTSLLPAIPEKGD